MKALFRIILALVLTLATSPAPVIINSYRLAATGGGGGGTFDATLYGTVGAWYRAEDVVTNPVSAWPDHSGNGKNLAQATGVLQPDLIANAQGAWSGVRFAGGKFVSIGASGFNCGTVIAVIGRITAGTANAVCGADSHRMITFFPDAVTIYGGDAGEFWGGSVPTRVNGVSTFTFPANPAFGVVSQTGTPADLGPLGVGVSGVNDPFIGDVLELVFYTNTLSTANQDSAAAALMAKYGL